MNVEAGQGREVLEVADEDWNLGIKPRDRRLKRGVCRITQQQRTDGKSASLDEPLNDEPPFDDE